MIFIMIFWLRQEQFPSLSLYAYNIPNSHQLWKIFFYGFSEI
jgi:hypothetical protein